MEQILKVPFHNTRAIIYHISYLVIVNFDGLCNDNEQYFTKNVTDCAFQQCLLLNIAGQISKVQYKQ